MNKSLLLAASILVNIGLATAYYVALPPAPKPDVAEKSGAPKPVATEAAAQPTGAPASASTAPLSAEERKTIRELWARLQSGDPKTYAENLRAAGFPPKMVRSLVLTALNERFVERFKALMADGPEADQPFWKNTPYKQNTERSEKLRALSKEQADLAKQALGPDALAGLEGSNAYTRRAFGNLPQEKIDAIRRVQTDYNEMTSKIHGEAGGAMLPEDFKKLDLLAKEQKADIAALLSPDEYADYELRNSNAASKIKGQFGSIISSEQEFRQLYQIQKAFEDQYPASQGPMAYDQETAKTRVEAQKALEAQYKAVLGDQRYEEYQRSKDYNYSIASRLVERLQLPKENATAVYDLRASSQTQYRQIMNNDAVSMQDRIQAVTNLAADVDAKLNTLLTPAGAATLKQQTGRWISVPRNAPRTTPANGAITTPALRFTPTP
jgi:hypothetical protein